MVTLDVGLSNRCDQLGRKQMRCRRRRMVHTQQVEVVLGKVPPFAEPGRDLAVMGATLANGCVNPVNGERALPLRRVRELLSVMHTCGMYDAAGQWAFDVGVPAKSGVSGGILAVIPGKMGIGVFSPGLDTYGNSTRGVRVCREISERLGLHVFASEVEDALLGESLPR